MQSMVCAVYFLILQILWFCHNIFVQKTIKNETFKNDKIDYTESDKKKRHMIRLTTKNSPVENGRPVCFMDVYELMSPVEEEILRKTCAKGSPDGTDPPYSIEFALPNESISKEHFTNLWLESFTLTL